MPADDDENDPTPALLDYASPPARRAPWGPLVFRPSLRSLLLLALAALAATWLALRHDPWRRVGTLSGDHVARPTFTRDGLLLTLDTRSGVNLYDPATGRPVCNVLPRIEDETYRYFVLDAGERVLALPYVEGTALLYDVRSGRVVGRLPNPDGLGSQLLLVAPDAPRLVTVRHPSPGDAPPVLRYWDLTRTPPTTRPVDLSPAASDPIFSPDGGRILQLAVRAGGVKLLDGRTLEKLRDETTPGDALHFGGFAGADRFWLFHTPPGSIADRFELRSAHDGARISSTPIPAGVSSARSAALAIDVADDARTFALLDLTGGGASMAGGPGRLYVIDVETGRVLLSRAAASFGPLQFLPGSRRLLAGDPATGRLALFEPPHAQPLVTLPDTGPFIGQPTVQVSPDGRTILTLDSVPHRFQRTRSIIGIYRPAGWDCPESRFGALAFPQTWLTAALLVLLTFSLLADARRARRPSSSRGVSPWLIGGLLLVGLPLTAHALAAACLGRWVQTPAPLLLLVGILLGTNARFWRGAALVLLAAMLPLLAYRAHALRKLGLRSHSAYPLFDRYYEVPHLISFVAVMVLAALAIMGICLLVRRRPAFDFA